MKEKNDFIFRFFYLGGDVLLGFFGNVGIISYAFQYRPRWIDLFVLTLCILGIYLLDRSYDSLYEKNEDRTNRGIFYQNKTIITIPFGIVFLAVALTVAILNYDPLFLKGGMILGIFITSYLFMHYFLDIPFFPKELLIALLYCAAVSYPIYFFRPIQNHEEWLIYILFFLSIFYEVLRLSLEDYEWDKKHGQSSFALSLGIKKTEQLLILIISLGLLIGAIALTQTKQIRMVGIGYLLYFLILGVTKKFLSKFPSHTRKVILELSYLPFLLYYLI